MKTSQLISYILFWSLFLYPLYIVIAGLIGMK